MSEVEETRTSNQSAKPRVIVHPGLPAGLTRPDGDENVYPSVTVDVVKILKAEGFEVVFAAGEEDRTSVAHFAAEVWFPILEFAAAAMAGAGGNLISNFVERLLRRDDDTTVVHLKWEVSGPKGHKQTFSYDGPSKGAVAAAKRFEKSLKGRRRDTDKK